jgi:hypothetical protein
MLSPPLVHCINTSFAHGVFPSALKTSIVKPLHKKGDKNTPNNYRGIYISTHFSKLYESLFKSRLEDFLAKNNVLSDNQHGFYKCKSTTTAMSSILSFTLDSIKQNRSVVLILIDLSRAFDCISHSLLLSKLDKLGVRGVTQDWCRSYLSQRLQRVDINHSSDDGTRRTFSSQVSPVTSGVFAGSILGAFLFNIFLNDLLLKFTGEDVKLVAYADDLTLCVSDSCLDNLCQKTNSALSTIAEWCVNNQLSINTDKTQLIVLSKNNVVLPVPVTLNTQTLTQCQQVSLLGVVIDDQLKWTDHVFKLVPKLRQSCYMFRVLRNTMNTEYLLVLYNAYFVSRVRYVLLVQKRCIRSMFGLRRRDSCRPYFLTYNIMTVVNVFVYEVAKYTYDNTGVLFYQGSHQHNTRTKTNIRVNNEQHSQFLLKIKIFNHLPLTLRNVEYTRQ